MKKLKKKNCYQTKKKLYQTKSKKVVIKLKKKCDQTQQQIILKKRNKTKNMTKLRKKKL